MKIQIGVYEKLVGLNPHTLFENGGILGGRDGIVSRIAFDKDYDSKCEPCCYAPNVAYLNGIIAEWIDKGDMFMGMFHTHMGDSQKLSNSDRKYISDIVRNMPAEISYLYFPIISLPSRKVTCFRAELDKDRVMISDSKLVIIRR